MKLRILSDLHLEFGNFTVKELPDDKETVLILAGDITVASNMSVMLNRFVPFMKRCSVQFKEVIMVMGNHEHYNGDITKTKRILESAIASCQNVWILENEWISVNNVAFIGATLWTDCGNDDPYATMHWHSMNDARTIKINGQALSVHEVQRLHKESKEFIMKYCEFVKKQYDKVVLITHHGVTSKSIHPVYRGDALNKFFKSDMDLDLIDASPDLVVHGHTHSALDYMIDETLSNTRVVCNPRGYHGYESSPESRGFNSILVIEI